MGWRRSAVAAFAALAALPAAAQDLRLPVLVPLTWSMPQYRSS